LTAAAQERVVLYDSDCGFCKWSLDKLLAWDRRRALRPVPIQSREGESLLAPIPPDKRLDSWHLITPDGAIHSAGAGAPFLFEVLPGGRPFAAIFRAFPGVTQRAYGWVAGHRDRLARIVGVDAGCQLRR
jgi:predicted DCC family thiol-disulfide oxidoreductase YuxK